MRAVASMEPDGRRSRAITLMLLACALTACQSIEPKSTAREESSVTKSVHPPLDDAFLDQLIGDWTVARAIRGTTVSNEMHARWVLEHQFVELDMCDPKNPPQYAAIVLIGYDTERKQYVAHWCDTFGGTYSGLGRGVRERERIEFRFDYMNGPFFNTFTWHPGDGSWTFRGENGSPDGTRSLFMEDTARRASSTSAKPSAGIRAGS